MSSSVQATPHSKRKPTSPAPHTVSPASHPAPTPGGPTSAISAGAEAGGSMEEDGFTKVMTKKERGKLRKVERHRPRFHFDQSAFKNGRKIGIAHIRDLVLYINADAQKPNWIFAENHSFISHTVVLLVPGLLPEHLGLPPVPILATLPFPLSPTSYDVTSPLPPSRVPAMEGMFSYGLPTRAPGDQRRLFSVLQTLLNSPLPENLRKEREKETKKATETAKMDGKGALMYLLSPNQMVENDYRLPSYVPGGNKPFIPGLQNGHDSLLNGSQGSVTVEEDPHEGVARAPDDGWVEVAAATGPPSGGRYPLLAMDCEMVLTGTEQALARVSVVDVETGMTVFDELVKPSKPITDYRTQWSGITAQKLEHATHTLSSIQEALVTGPSPLITPNTILLGHSLECDLTALRVKHPLCIDTAIIFTHPRGPAYKPGLKWLAQKWLGREIQTSVKGHDSVEDATTCVDLLKLKIAHGTEFGMFMDNSEPIFERIRRYKRYGSDELRSSVVCGLAPNHRIPSTDAVTYMQCADDDAVIKAMKESVAEKSFVFGRLMELSNVQGWNTDHAVEALPTPKPNGTHAEDASDDMTARPSALSAALESLNERLRSLHEGLPADTALIVLSGHSSPLEIRRLSDKRHKWERLVKTLGGTEGVPKEDRWMAEDDRELEAAVSEAREGMAFFCVK